jgi:hypothetical protein
LHWARPRSSSCATRTEGPLQRPAAIEAFVPSSVAVRAPSGIVNVRVPTYPRVALHPLLLGGVGTLERVIARRNRLGLLTAFLLGVGGYALTYASHTGHRRPPTPSGMVFRVETREMVSPDDGAEVYAVTCDGPAVAIATRATRRHEASLTIHRYPEGTCLKRWRGADALREVAEGPFAKPVTLVSLDLDGDGTLDPIAVGAKSNPFQSAESPQDYQDYGVVRILSGRDDRILFENRDPLEYEGTDRAIPLGDLDGDGFSELALLHPRMDRDYDFENVWDVLFGAKSWVTVISGSRLAP